MAKKKDIRPLRNEADYEAALAEIEQYFEAEPKPGTPAADRFDLLALVIEDYEKKHWPIEAPDPVDAIRYRMQIGGLTQTDLGKLLGSRQRASDILARRRPVTLDMAWKLHREWNIPAESLIYPQIPTKPQGRRFYSSTIQNIVYDARAKRLLISFVTGRKYVYENVPKTVYEAFLKAPSKGRFFSSKIRDRYTFRDAEKLAG